MKAAIDKMVNSLFDGPDHTSLVVGVLNREGRAVLGYGRVRTDPPDEHTLFEIGSVTKVFTASLLAILADEGHFNLEDPVAEHMPCLSHLPVGMTLLSLATHTAGLPKMPSNLWRSAIKDRRNPNAAYSTADLFHYLTRYRPKRGRLAGGQISYSNLGYALLGHILAQRCDSTYEEAIISCICNALALDDTRITLNPEQQERLALPHTASGKPCANWDLDAFAGAGALRSTADNLLRFLAVNLGNSRLQLAKTLQRCHQIHSEIFRRSDSIPSLVLKLFRHGDDIGRYRQGMALGWHVGYLTPGSQRFYWHHGATDGYRAFTGFINSSQIGVVVLANRGPSTLDLISLETSEDTLGVSLLAYLDSLSP